MARVLPFLIILLIGLAVARKDPNSNHVKDRDLPPAARRRVLELRRELQELLTAACKRLILVIKQMKWARECIYNGLPFPEYERQRAICKNRSESLDALREYRSRCNADPSLCDEAEEDKLLWKRKMAVAACARIGWDGDKDCPDLRALKAEFEKLKGSCTEEAGRIREIREEIKRVKANFARPSVLPVARIAV